MDQDRTSGAWFDFLTLLLIDNILFQKDEPPGDAGVHRAGRTMPLIFILELSLTETTQ